MIKEEYKKFLEKYPGEASKASRDFFEKHWLSEDEYIGHCDKIKKNIFQPNISNLSKNIFKEGYEFFALLSGGVFSEEEFNALKNCLNTTGDTSFIVIEDAGTDTLPLNRFKFDINVSWDELLSGGDISQMIFMLPFRNYFVFGDTGNWGKYTCNDFNPCFDILGFKPQYSDVFKSSFQYVKRDYKILKRSVTDYYQKYILKNNENDFDKEEVLKNLISYLEETLKYKNDLRFASERFNNYYWDVPIEFLDEKLEGEMYKIAFGLKTSVNKDNQIFLKNFGERALPRIVEILPKLKALKHM